MWKIFIKLHGVKQFDWNNIGIDIYYAKILCVEAGIWSGEMCNPELGQTKNLGEFRLILSATLSFSFLIGRSILSLYNFAQAIDFPTFDLPAHPR